MYKEKEEEKERESDAWKFENIEFNENDLCYEDEEEYKIKKDARKIKTNK